MSEFDQEAAHYDTHFTHSCVGIEQRQQVYMALEGEGLFSNQTVLEINCGTGVDALEFHLRGNAITATDQSATMLDVARKRFPEGTFSCLDMRDIGGLSASYSLIFSNFGGLNCLSPKECSSFLADAATRLNAGGKLVLIVMGKRCWWERWYFFFKGKWKLLSRRNTDQAVEVALADGLVSTWYYSPKQLQRMAADRYEVCAVKPIGLFVPPSYLAPYFEKRTRIFQLLKNLDARFRPSSFSNFSDHFYLSLRKK